MTVKDLGTKRLETERLILRRFTLEDAEKMYENWAGDPEVTKFLTWPTHESAEISRQILKEWVAAYDNPEIYQWCIEEKESGEPVGSIAVVSRNEKGAVLRDRLLHQQEPLAQRHYHGGTCRGHALSV